MILGCLLVAFFVTGFGAEASSFQKNGRPQFCAKLLPVKTIHRRTFSVNKYEKLVNKFYKQNYPNEQVPDIRKEIVVPAAELCRVGKMLGFKEYNVGEGKKGIPSIDLSWPNIKRVFNKKYKEVLKEKNKCIRARAEKLRSIIKATNNASRNSFSLTSIQESKIIDLCTREKDCLFDLSELEENYRVGFEKQLLLILKNYTGFQRIMSMLAVGILNSTQHAFVQDFNNIAVVVDDEEGNSFSEADRILRLKKCVFEGDDFRILHESTHAYHYMVLGSLDLSACKSAYPVLVSDNADLLKFFYPMLAEEKIDKATKEIVKWLDTFSVDDLRSLALKIPLEPFKPVVNAGLGNLVFSNGNVDIKNTLSKEQLAKAIYVCYSSLILVGTNLENIWEDCEEMLTMTGLAPITDGYNTYLVEDRQNEEIYRTKQQGNLKNDEGRYSQFTFHAGNHETRLIISNIATALSFFHVGYMKAQGILKKEDIERILKYLQNLYAKCMNAQGTQKENLRPEKFGFTSGNFSTVAKRESDDGTFNYLSNSYAKCMNIQSTIKEDIDTSLKRENLRFNDTSVATKYDERISRDISANLENDNGFSPLHVAVLTNDLDEIGALSNDRKNLNLKDKTGNTPLHMAVEYGSKQAIEILLYYGADPNATDMNEETPLHRAINSKNVKAVKALLKSNITYDTIMDCYDNAENLSKNIANLLRDRMADLKTKRHKKQRNDSPRRSSSREHRRDYDDMGSFDGQFCNFD
ncbi:hypothetical protein FACS189449_09380 [Alphaproteobacteria bacterium]|nr:hypothetical protein FACS189449_09380 [Alphaproteobacteria bacterium]